MVAFAPMGIPARPLRLTPEGPADSCIINGRLLGWTNCTPASFGMGVSRTTLHRSNPSPCAIRRLTGDTSGGTTIPQNAAAIRAEYGVSTEVRVGSNVATPHYLAARLREGRGEAWQGNAGAFVGTKHRVTKGNVNHCIWVNEGRGWFKNSAGHWLPTEVRVYDPAADGKTVAWGTRPKGAQWMKWTLLLKFAAALRPWGDFDSRTLGPGKVYSAVFPDTEPHAHLRFVGSVRTVPFPDAMTIHSPVSGQRVNVRSGPSTKYPIVTTMPTGASFVAYQRNPQGQALTTNGVTSRVWYGDHNGRWWVHASGIRT